MGIVNRVSWRISRRRKRSVNKQSEDTKPACCTLQFYEITSADLPLSCPPREMRVWDGHPRVYLSIEEVGQVVCPYCGTKYVLKDFLPPEKPLIVD